jgi:hypothetical protein
VLGLQLHSFVTATKPQHSLNHNLESLPFTLAGDTAQVTCSVSIFQCPNPWPRAHTIARWSAEPARLLLELI